jgi:mRNA-degrading endonuclease RelE of RelBE toxin-antitoxin system
MPSRISAAFQRPFRSVERVIAQMASDPFQGDVKALQGEEWRGVFRRRLGDYRLFFTVDHGRQKVVIHQITLRSGKTYR